MEKTKIGIVGCGNISGIYFQAGKRFEDIEIVACTDLDFAKAQAAAEKNQVRALEMDAFFEDPEIQIVVNLTIPAAHGEVALRALKAGKSIYNEKPLAQRRREAREMIGLAREKGLRVGCAPDTFLGGGLQTCRKLIDEGAIGEPIGATAFMLGRGVETWHPNPHFFYKKGAGPLFDMGPYYLTALISLLGPVKSLSGSARISFPRREITSQPLAGEVIEVETPTHVSGLLDFETGASATLITSFDVTKHQLPFIEIYGAEGTLSLPDPNTFGGAVKLYKRGWENWDEAPLEFGYSDNSRGLGLADMASAIRTGRDHRCNERLSYHVLDVMHSILDSAESGRRIEIASHMTRPEPLPLGLADGRVDL